MHNQICWKFLFFSVLNFGLLENFAELSHNFQFSGMWNYQFSHEHFQDNADCDNLRKGRHKFEFW